MLKWFKIRFGIKPIEENFIYHRVTKTPWYYGDGSTLLMLFGVLVITGCFLGLTYSPSPETAYESVVQITLHNFLGWFLRALHYWSAGMMVVVAVFHLLRQILIGGYQPPREGTWLIGVGLFIFIIINSFVGYTLRWDERAVYAIRVALNMFSYIPVIGEEVVHFILGGESVGARTLSRFYAVHTLFVPLGILALVAYHLYLVVLLKPTSQEELIDPPATAKEQMEMVEEVAESKQGQDFHPYTTAKSGAMALSVFIVVVLLASLLGPARLYDEANFTKDTMPMEEWWWHWYSALIAYLPPKLAPVVYLGLPIGLFCLLVILPFVDKSTNRGVRRRPLAVLSVIIVLCALLGLTGLRIKSPWTAWPTTELAPLPQGVPLPDSVKEGRRLFTKYGCFNCHSVGGHGSKVGPNLTGLEVRLSPSELANYILEPPKDIPMPSYRGHIPSKDLDKIVDFVLVLQTLPRKYAKEHNP